MSARKKVIGCSQFSKNVVDHRRVMRRIKRHIWSSRASSIKGRMQAPFAAGNIAGDGGMRQHVSGFAGRFFSTFDFAPNRRHIARMAKPKVSFKPVRVAEGDWHILAECPGVEPIRIEGFKSKI